MRVFKKSRLVAKSAFLLALCMTASLVLSVPAPSAKAVYITTADSANLSKYASMIDWIDWSQADAAANRRDPDGYKKKIGAVNKKTGGAALTISNEPYSKYHVVSRRNVGPNSEVVTKCYVRPVYIEPTRKKTDKGPNPRPTKADMDPGISFHIAGAYGMDPFDRYYGGGKVVGLGRKGSGQSTMEVLCSAELEHPGAPSIPVPIEGLVFADGETSNLANSGFREFFEITPFVPNDSSNGNKEDVNWRVLEYEPGINCQSGRGNVEIRRGLDNADYRKIGRGSGNKNLYTRAKLVRNSRNEIVPDLLAKLKGEDTVRVRGVQKQCGKGGKQPFVSVYAENATGAYLDLYGAGGNYVAVGVVLGVDFGDAPSTYGVAGAVVQPEISGGVIPKTGENQGRIRRIDEGDNLEAEENKHPERATLYEEDYAVNIWNNLRKKPQPKYAHAPYLGKHGPDPDLTDQEAARSDIPLRKNFTFDDRESLEDDGSLKTDAHLEEDALGDTRRNLLVYVGPHTYDLDVVCHPDSQRATYVYAWLDWNGNGTFEENERAKQQCVSGTAKTKLSWTVDQATVNALSVGATKSALRLIATTDTNVTATGVYSDGEVEDHAATLIRPKLTLHKELTDPGKGNVSIAGWNFNAEDSDKISALNAGQSTAVTNASGDAVYQLKDKTTDPLPLDVRDNNGNLDLYFTETPKDDYSLAPFDSKACALAQRPTGAGWQLPGNTKAYAWPDAAPTVSNDGGKVKVSGTKAAILSSGVTCDVDNQPDGSFTVTPSITVDGGLESGSTLKTGLQFKGDFTCSKSGETDVTGKWGPVDNGATWTYHHSDTGKRIPPGFQCRITDMKVVTNDLPEGVIHPVDGPDAQLYSLERVEYTPAQSGDATDTDKVVTSANGNVQNSRVPDFRFTYHVVKQSQVSISWTKVNPADALLEGAEFSLTKPDGSKINGISDCVANSDADCTGQDKNHEAGKFRVEKMPVGDYQLAETKAPVGYKKLDSPISFSVVASDVKTGKTLDKVVNHPYSSTDLPTLPLTGGASTDSFLIAGGLVGLLSLGLAYAAKRRRARA